METSLSSQSEGCETRDKAVNGWHMIEPFNHIVSMYRLSSVAAESLKELGFVVIPSLMPVDRLEHFAEAFDHAVASAIPGDIHIGSTTTRVNDFVNRGRYFDEVYLYEPILAACCQVIGQPFKLSVLHARSVHPNAPEQSLHVDFAHDEQGWPMVGFIIMVDEFRKNNGATRFVPGSHKWTTTPDELATSHQPQMLACGPAGSLIIYNGSVWHGHSANLTNEPRRSLQGAYIRRDAAGWFQQNGRMLPETLDRISELAKYLLAAGQSRDRSLRTAQ